MELNAVEQKQHAHAMIWQEAHCHQSFVQKGFTTRFGIS